MLHISILRLKMFALLKIAEFKDRLSSFFQMDLNLKEVVVGFSLTFLKD